MEASPYIGMFGLSVWAIRAVMLEVVVVSTLLMAGSMMCRLLLSHRLALVGLFGSLAIGVLLMVGPWMFLVRYLPMLVLVGLLYCGVVGCWRLRGMGRARQWIREGARWWWHPFREDASRGGMGG